MIRLLLTLIPLYWSFNAVAVEPRTEHTFKLAEGEEAPGASVEDLAWLAGSWTGTAFGSRFEAVWTPPSAGSMVGLFKLMDDHEVAFYEILTLSIDEGSLAIKVKHFSSDFIAWEEKDKYTRFRLVQLEERAAHFNGISFYRISEDRFEAYIVMRSGDSIREERLVYERRPH